MHFFLAMLSAIQSSYSWSQDRQSCIYWMGIYLSYLLSCFYFFLPLYSLKSVTKKLNKTYTILYSLRKDMFNTFFNPKWRLDL